MMSNPPQAFNRSLRTLATKRAQSEPSGRQTHFWMIAGSRLVVYPGAGYALYWEEPGRGASDIAAFIETLDR